MTTALKLGVADSGRRLTLEEYEAADYAPGHKYELIFGRLDVSPLPDVPQEYVENWIHRTLLAYRAARPDVINYVTPNARVFVEGHEEVSFPEPDVTAYHDYPHDRFETVPWRELHPILVVEILDPDRPGKDLVRNPDVYI
ncbi:MAG: Uma2 family endonuclease, partial [Gemmataceae bacterium]